MGGEKQRLVINDARVETYSTGATTDTRVRLYCVTEGGKSNTSVYLEHFPGFYVRAQENLANPALSTSPGSVFKLFERMPGFASHKSRVVKGRRFTYFEPAGDFYEVRFRTERQKWAGARAARDASMEVFQDDIDEVVAYFAEHDLDVNGWIEVDVAAARGSSTRPLSPSEVRAVDPACTPVDRSVVAYFDIEQYTRLPFPDSRVKEDVVFMVCTVLREMGSDEPHAVLAHAVGAYRPDVESVVRDRFVREFPRAGRVEVLVRVFETEGAMLRAWCDDLGKRRPSYMVGHNSFGYDLPCLYTRMVGWFSSEKRVQSGPDNPGHASNAGHGGALSKLGRASARDADLKYNVLKTTTAANGWMENRFFDVPGVTQVDSLVYFRRYFTGESDFSLNALAAKFLDGAGKDSVTFADMFEAYRAGDAAVLTDALEYCFQDVALVVKLDQKLKFVSQVRSYSNTFCVPKEYILTRGQTVRVTAQVLRFCSASKDDRVFLDGRPDRGKKRRLPTGEEEEPQEGKYQGATVLEPKTGFYSQNLAATLDFASLYPSIMMAWSLCMSLLHVPEALPPGARVEVEQHTVEVDNKPCDVPIVLAYNGAHTRGVFPKVLEWLKAQRKKAKNTMEKAQLALADAASQRARLVDSGASPDELKRLDDATKESASLFTEMNACQLAIKVSMNSMYGFLGTTTNHLVRPALASLVTAKGRQLLLDVQKYLDEHNAEEVEVLYGDTDSVMFRFLHLDPEKPASLQTAFERGEQLAGVITRHLQGARSDEISRAAPSVPGEVARGAGGKIVLEFEKTLESFLLLSKKRYTALCRELDWRKPPKLLVKGLDLARRTISRTVIQKTKSVLEHLLESRDTQEAHDLMTTCARSLLGTGGLDPDDPALYYSSKLNHQYKKRALFRPVATGRAAKGDVVVRFDGTWSPVCKDAEAAAGASATVSLPCTRRAYAPWALCDAGGKVVGHVSFSEPHVHAALDDEESSPGSGPRPGDRVFFAYLSEPHHKAESTVLAFDGRPAFCYSRARTASAIREKGLTLLVDKYYTDYVSGVSSFMSVACGNDPTAELNDIGRERRAAAREQVDRATQRARREEKAQAGALAREWNTSNGQHSINKFFVRGSAGGAWLPPPDTTPEKPPLPAPVPNKKQKKGPSGPSILDLLRRGRPPTLSD